MMQTALKKMMMLCAVAAACSTLATTAIAQQEKAKDMPPRPAKEECVRCHDVKMYDMELKISPHAVDKDKKEISCEQCHQFHYSPLTSYYARDDYYDKKIFEPGAFDRRKLQKNARNGLSDAKCQECHKDLTKNGKGDAAVSELGQICHDAYLGKNGMTRKNCAGCHINIAHLPKFDRDLQINAEFAQKLTEAEATMSVKKEDK